MEFKSGVTRKVILIFNIAIKIPNTEYSHNNFLQGCVANWSERNFCKMFKDANYDENLYEFVAPSYFCSWFGLIQIQARCEKVVKEIPELEIKKYIPLCGTDIKKENFGYFNGKLVCLDYP